MAQRKSCIKPLHVINGVNSNAALTNLPGDTIGIAIQPVQRWTIESRTEPNRLLMTGQIVKAAVGVFGKP